MKDVAPEILEKVQKDFKEAIRQDSNIRNIYRKIQKGEAAYGDVAKLGAVCGKALAEAFGGNISSKVLPDGKMYYNIAQRVVGIPMKQLDSIITNAAINVQENLNKKAKVGLKAILPQDRTDRIDGIINRLSSEVLFDDVAWILNEPVVTFGQSVADDFVKANAEFQYNAGLRPTVTRIAIGNCCTWCAALEGTYEYPGVPDDVYRRHDNCNCIVEYSPADGRKQDVHSKKWFTSEESQKRIEFAESMTKSEQTPQQREFQAVLRRGDFGQITNYIETHPGFLGSYTPDSFKKAIEEAGYKTTPLGLGDLKKLPYDKGGGYRTIIDNQYGILYHPTKGSHHGGAYYKFYGGKEKYLRRYWVDGKPENSKK